MNKESLIEQLLGKGADATLTIGDNYAHNDWLEILINNGILGIIIFILYWTGFYQQARKFKKGHIRAAFFLTFIMGLLKTFFSMYYTAITTPMAFTLGLCLSQIKKHKYESSIPNQSSKNMWTRESSS